MLHIVTVATESKYYLPYLYDTCARAGCELDVLGYGEKWNGYIFKLEKMIEFLRLVNPEDVICFVDGYDVVCTRDLIDFIPVFMSIRDREKCKIVISEDGGYLPKVISKLYFGMCAGKLINAGAYAGLAGDILGILLEARDLYPMEKDDQILLTKYCDMHPTKFFVDNKKELFHSHIHPLSEASVVGNPFFVHAAGCGYLNNILTDMGYEVNPEIKVELRRYFFKKAGEHTTVFLRRYILWFIIFILIVVILTY